MEPDALAPPNPALRKNMFGDATFGLLYSGTLRRAHDYDLFLKLARCLRYRSPNVRCVLLVEWPGGAFQVLWLFGDR